MKKLLTLLLCLSLFMCGMLTSCKKDEVIKTEEQEKVVSEDEKELEVPEIPFEYEIDKELGTAIIKSYIGENETQVTVPSIIPAVVSVPLTDEEIAALEAEEAKKAQEEAKANPDKEPVKKKKSTKTPTKKVIQEYNVSAIANGAFFANEVIESVTIEEGIETLGSAAFQNCKALKSVILPESLTKIGDRAFYGCESLAELNIGSNVNSIGYMAFSDFFFKSPWYSSLSDTSVIVGDGVLLKYNGTGDVVFGDEVKHVAYHAFENSTVKNVTFSSEAAK